MNSTTSTQAGVSVRHPILALVMSTWASTSGRARTEVVEEVAEVGAGLRVGGVGPERVGEGRAVERGAGLEHESGHELDEARGVERVDRLAVGADGGLAEQADLERGVGRHVWCLARIVA